MCKRENCWQLIWSLKPRKGGLEESVLPFLSFLSELLDAPVAQVASAVLIDLYEL